ncbi:endospore germination permease [Cohnella sp. LGH]|uniref:GerAB/ArcD/ProY family transporter n=1 Tax=Cohnella sp. LGH TaxID=1619153 RepID=UPI001ADA91EF|nr:endospore germination permease [Cohnella sp. LGH]QTH45133.1 endospore germination permease [Cohnella sp. LGH]
MRQVKISIIQAIFLFNLAIGITNHVIIVPLILQSAYRDSWISALLAVPAVILWTIVVYRVMNMTKQQSLYQWFKQHYNPFVAWLVILPLILLCATILFITVRDTTAWTKVTYLPKTPYPITVILFVASGMVAAAAGLRTVAIAAGILLPGVVAFGVFVMSVNFQFKDYSYLLPVFSNSASSILRGTQYTLGGLVEFILLLALQQHLSKKFRLRALLILTLAVTGLVFGPLLAAITIFGPFEAADQRYPAFEQWRMLMLGKFISHLDFLSIYQWLSGSLIRVALAFYLMFDLLQLSERKLKLPLMALVGCVLVVIITDGRISDAHFLHFIGQYFPIVMTFFYAFPFVLLLMILPKRGKAHETQATVT